MNEQLWIIIGSLITFFVGGGFYKVYFIDRKKNNVDTLGTFATEWQKLYLNEQAGMAKLEEKFVALSNQVSDLQKQNEDKIGRIKILEDENKDLKEEIKKLKKKLLKYEEITEKTETARTTLHESVDASIDEIKKPSENI